MVNLEWISSCTYRKRLGEEGIIKREGPSNNRRAPARGGRGRALFFYNARRPRASSNVIHRQLKSGQG
jgi:hypothetical protein